MIIRKLIRPTSCFVAIATFFVLYTIINIELYSSHETKWRITKENNYGKNPRTSLFFLKTHKCGSSTVQNIIMRFGSYNGLYFALPKAGNYLGHPERFHPGMIDKKVTPHDKKFDIFAHHTRYMHESVKKVMKKSAAFVTILRDPAEVMESIVSYYKGGPYGIKLSLQSLLTNPDTISFKRSRFSKFGLNQMLFDLGFDEQLFTSTDDINDYIEKINSEFDLVMIAEHMEASMVLFANLMRWPLQDVTYLNLNSRGVKKRTLLNESHREILHKVNMGDWLLYKTFLSKLHDKINTYGKEKMLSDVNKLITLNIDLKSKCILSVDKDGSSKIIEYELKSNDSLCVDVTRSEFDFTNEIHSAQRYRLKVLNKLQKFIYS